MSDRQLDARVARALGNTGALMGGDAYLATQVSREDIFPYSSDHTAVATLRELVAQRELQGAYLSALADLCGFEGRDFEDLGYGALWPLINATPEQQCRAFLRACSVEDV